MNFSLDICKMCCCYYQSGWNRVFDIARGPQYVDTSNGDMMLMCISVYGMIQACSKRKNELDARQVNVWNLLLRSPWLHKQRTLTIFVYQGKICVFGCSDRVICGTWQIGELDRMKLKLSPHNFWYLKINKGHNLHVSCTRLSNPRMAIL